MSTILQANIREKLSQKGITVKQLEIRAGIKPSAVQNILIGRSKNPGIETIYALSKELGCTIEELLSSPSNRLHDTTNLPWNETILIKCIQSVSNFIEKNNINPPNLESVWTCIKEIYAYSLKENANNTIDEKFAEWITERNLMRN